MFNLKIICLILIQNSLCKLKSRAFISIKICSKLTLLYLSMYSGYSVHVCYHCPRKILRTYRILIIMCRSRRVKKTVLTGKLKVSEKISKDHLTKQTMGSCFCWYLSKWSDHISTSSFIAPLLSLCLTSMLLLSSRYHGILLKGVIEIKWWLTPRWRAAAAAEDVCTTGSEQGDHGLCGEEKEPVRPDSRDSRFHPILPLQPHKYTSTHMHNNQTLRVASPSMLRSQVTNMQL